MMGEEVTEFWFNMKTGEVEEGKQSLALYRIGPFEDRDSAEHALEIVASRSAAWADEENDDLQPENYSLKDSSGEGKPAD
jgi:hypothetical protein